jgi:uncharacterized protein YbcV (DUF1398 family)
MDARARMTAEECTAGSEQDRLSFPEVLAKLGADGFERYHADLSRGERTYYQASGESIVTRTAGIAVSPVERFSAAGVEAALRAVQAREIGYGEFCARIAAAGCSSYWVSLAGRRAVYVGRTGELHVEHFPPRP